MLLEKLSEHKLQDPEGLFIHTTRIQEEQGRVINLYFQTKEMRMTYLRYRDFVFINKRLIKTRFKRNLLIFCGVNFDGKTVVYGVALLKEDD